MKFIIKTSAIGISDQKYAFKGEYETEENKEIERLKNIAKHFPEDIEEIKNNSKPTTQKKNSPSSKT